MVIPKLLTSLAEFQDPDFIDFYKEIEGYQLKVYYQRAIDSLEKIFQNPKVGYVYIDNYEHFRSAYKISVMDSKMEFVEKDTKNFFDFEYWNLFQDMHLSNKMVSREDRFTFYKTYFPENKDIIFNIENNLKPELQYSDNYGFKIYHNFSKIHHEEYYPDVKKNMISLSLFFQKFHILMEQKFIFQLEKLFAEYPVDYIGVGNNGISIKLMKDNKDDKNITIKEKLLNKFYNQEYVKNFYSSFNFRNLDLDEQFTLKYKIQGSTLNERVEGYKELLNSSKQENHQLFLFTLMTQNERKNILSNIEQTLDTNFLSNKSKRRI